MNSIDTHPADSANEMVSARRVNAQAATRTLPKPGRKLVQPTSAAIKDFDLIREGDRVLVGLSGGKDSMGLLQLLLYFQQRAPIRFELAATTIDPTMAGFDPAPLTDWVTSLGVEHYLHDYSLGRYAHGSFQGKSLCSFCARMRRGKLYGVAREQGFNVIALGHHLDDAAETFLMNSFFGGKLRSMRAAYTIDDGDLRVIRPLIYTREADLAINAEQSALPLIEDNCPSCDNKPTQRNAMKELLAGLEQQHSQLFASLKTAIKPLLEGKHEPVEQLADTNIDMNAGTADHHEQPITFSPTEPAANPLDELNNNDG